MKKKKILKRLDALENDATERAAQIEEALYGLLDLRQQILKLKSEIKEKKKKK